jgi:septal ring factor EnvC (AmiA/AmiB activator)
MNDTALATLQRTLSENREAKRKMLARLAEIESESASLRSQLASLDAVIERTEQALLQLLFPVDRAVDRALQNQPAPAPNAGTDSLADGASRPGSIRSTISPPASGRRAADDR